MISPLTTPRRSYGNDVREDVEHGPLKLPSNDCTLTRVIDFFQQAATQESAVKGCSVRPVKALKLDSLPSAGRRRRRRRS